eukprot:scaffold1231_cov187-Pinguiococcus_pyrenoidosus.AAC.20
MGSPLADDGASKAVDGSSALPQDAAWQLPRRWQANSKRPRGAPGLFHGGGNQVVEGLGRGARLQTR